MSEITGVGIHTGIHNDIYRAFEAVSYSDLKAWITGETFKATAAMDIGTVLHDLILEPEDAKDRFVVGPANLDRRKKADKAVFAEWQKIHPGKTILMPRQFAEVEALHEAVKACPLAMKIINAEGDNEVSVITQMPGRKILSKCRIDMVRKGLHADLKTTGAKDQAQFESSIADFVYDGQGAYYTDQVANVTGEHKKWAWICVSKRSLECWVTMLKPWHYATGKRWYTDNLKLKERYEDG